MSFTFDRTKLRFEMVFVTGGWSTQYDKNVAHFKAYGIKIPAADKARTHSGDDHDTYQVKLNGATDCFKACVVTASHFYYKNDDQFLTWSEHAFYALSKVSAQEKNTLAAVENDFSALQLKKNQELLATNNKLQEIAAIFSLTDSSLALAVLTEKNSHKVIFEQNKLLVEENNKLYKKIIEAARKKSDQYNEEALKAIILSLSMGYVAKKDPSLVSEAKTAYTEYLTPPADTTTNSTHIPLVAQVNLPEAGTIHPFLEPTTEFPHLNAKEDYYRETEKALYDNNRWTITSSDVDTLKEKVTRLVGNHEQCKKVQKGWFNFLTVIKSAFNHLYEKIIATVTTAKQSSNPVEKHSDLAENVENITSGKQVSKTAKLIHRFNSRPSPLVHVIYDKELTDEEKEDLLTKLAHAKPYRFKHEKMETRKNIEIPSPALNGGYFNYSPLYHAVTKGTAAMVRILLENGAKPDVIKHTESYGDDENVLYTAVEKGDLEKVKLLLEYGAEVNAPNKTGQTALHVVENEAIFELLLKYGADINQKDHNGQTPLHFAVKKDKTVIFNALVKQEKLQVDAQDKIGNTPLHLACATSFEMEKNPWASSFFSSNSKEEEKKTRNLTMMSALIKKGANVNQKNQNGYVPLHLAVLYNSGTIGSDYDQNSYNNCGSCLDYQHVQKQVQCLCENGADVNILSEKYQKPEESFSSSDGTKFHPAPMTTPLLALYTQASFEAQREEALAQERLAVAKYLIEQGANYKLNYHQADYSFSDYQKEGNSLLHQCAHFGDAKAFAYFVSLGLDPNYQASRQHNTPFHEYVYQHTDAAYHYWNDKDTAKMQTLFDSGVDVNKTTDVKIKIDSSTLAKNSGVALQLPVIAAIFRHDNIISRKAKAMQLEINDTNGREILAEVHKTILAEEKQSPYATITVTVPLTAGEYAYTRWQSHPSQQAIDMINQQSERSLAKPALTMK